VCCNPIHTGSCVACRDIRVELSRARLSGGGRQSVSEKVMLAPGALLRDVGARARSLFQTMDLDLGVETRTEDLSCRDSRRHRSGLPCACWVRGPSGAVKARPASPNSLALPYSIHVLVGEY